MKDLKQHKDGWCGPASLSFAMLKKGKYITQEEIAKETETTIGEGVDPASLVRFVKDKGFTPTVLKDGDPNKTLTKLGYFASKGKSILVDYLSGDSYDCGHYVVLQGVDKNVLVWDPESGKQETIPKKQFINHWRDKTEEGQVFKYWALVF